MTKDNLAKQLVTEAEDAYSQSLRIDSLIGVYHRCNFASIEEGNIGYAMDVLVEQSAVLRNMLDELAASIRRQGIESGGAA